MMAPKNRPKQPPAKPLANPYVPRYVSPKERAENRARWRRFFYGTAAVLAIVVMLMLYGYSDQAPARLRAATEVLDANFGYPILRLIALIAGP
jgi:hypothetical protein